MWVCEGEVVCACGCVFVCVCEIVLLGEILLGECLCGDFFIGEIKVKFSGAICVGKFELKLEFEFINELKVA